ncbi:MAG TPA: hypothetical protein VMF30_01795, partial [Pirellulales bacterium]|nr:hypothetical protein [Pirellulales bacterium]
MIRVPIRVIWMVALQAVVAFGGQVLAAGGAGEPKTSPTASPESASPPGDFVRGAMAAESRGDRVERERLVEQALVIAPDYAPARWLAGQVRSQDEWLAIDNVLEKNAQDGALAEYQKLRAVYAKSPEGELTLARWCQKHHLMDEMRAHASRLLTVRQNDPELLKMLDLVWHKGQLIATAELAERRERDEQTKQAMQHWRPIISA